MNDKKTFTKLFYRNILIKKIFKLICVIQQSKNIISWGVAWYNKNSGSCCKAPFQTQETQWKWQHLPSLSFSIFTLLRPPSHTRDPMEMTTFAFTLFLYIYSVGPLSHPRDPMEMTIFPFTLILYIYSVEAPFTHTRPNGNDDISLHSLSLYLLCWGPHDDYSFEGTGRACCSLEHVARRKIPNSPSVWS